jgi:hypothetical protein
VLLLHVGGELVHLMLTPVVPSLPLISKLLSAVCGPFTLVQRVLAQRGGRLPEDHRLLACPEHIHLKCGGSTDLLGQLLPQLYGRFPGGHRVFAQAREALQTFQLDLTLVPPRAVTGRLVLGRAKVPAVRGDLTLLQAGFAPIGGQIARASQVLPLVGLTMAAGQVVLGQAHVALAGLQVNLPLASHLIVPVAPVLSHEPIMLAPASATPSLNGRDVVRGRQHSTARACRQHCRDSTSLEEMLGELCAFMHGPALLVACAVVALAARP